LGKRSGADGGHHPHSTDEAASEHFKRGHHVAPLYENQSSFATFMQKKGDVIARLMEEKGVNEVTCEENFSFKSHEWTSIRDKHRKVGGKHTKNLK
jgi:hypothetical protein